MLGRTVNNTLKLETRDDGLYFSVEVPDTSWAKDLATSVRRGDIDKMSFGFIPLESRWLDDKETIEKYKMPIREITKLELKEISIVPIPAYSNTAVRELEPQELLQEDTGKLDNIDNAKIDNEIRSRKVSILKIKSRS